MIHSNVNALDKNQKRRKMITEKEQFRNEIIKLVLLFHDSKNLKADDQINILKDILKTADDAKRAVADTNSDWFDECRKKWDM